MTHYESQLLLLDADDTLWENNIYFERVKRRFLEIASPDPATWPAATLCINREERRVIAEHGYGVHCFALAIQRAFQHLAPDQWSPAAEAEIAALATSIYREPVELMPGAAETLDYLAGRHRLWLLTKGDLAEQTRKLALSGLQSRFEQIRVVAEKNEPVYRQIMQELHHPAKQCWMVGNSPRSDINPALAAGLNAVYIPHPQTWILECGEVASVDGRECLQIEQISELRQYF